MRCGNHYPKRGRRRRYRSICRVLPVAVRTTIADRPPGAHPYEWHHRIRLFPKVCDAKKRSSEYESYPAPSTIDRSRSSDNGAAPAPPTPTTAPLDPSLFRKPIPPRLLPISLEPALRRQRLLLHKPYPSISKVISMACVPQSSSEVPWFAAN